MPGVFLILHLCQARILRTGYKQRDGQDFQGMTIRVCSQCAALYVIKRIVATAVMGALRNIGDRSIDGCDRLAIACLAATVAGRGQ